MPKESVAMLCTYRIKKGKEKDFLGYLERHWPTLDRAGLVSSERPRVWKGVEKSGTVTFIETFEWKNARAPEVAHQTPEIMAIWEPMGGLAEEMHFLEIEPVH
ncbi:MAG: hypothetical protein ABI682_09430 [Acidobacteriota bacterium]